MWSPRGCTLLPCWEFARSLTEGVHRGWTPGESPRGDQPEGVLWWGLLEVSLEGVP